MKDCPGSSPRIANFFFRLLLLPLTGLDSTASMEVVQIMRAIAEKGMTVVTVLHQPRYEIFQLFHNVLLLGKGGRTCYFGPSQEAVPYFEKLGFKFPEKVNAPDYMMDIISSQVKLNEKQTADELFEAWKEFAEDSSFDNLNRVPEYRRFAS